MGTLGLGMARSSPPYFKQPPGSSKVNSANYYQPPTTGPSEVLSANSTPYGSSIGPHALSAGIAHVPTGGGYHHRANVLKCLPLANAIPLAGGSPTTAGYEYYRYAIEAAESVGKLQSSQPIHVLPTNTIAPTIDESPKGTPAPLMDYNGLRQLFLKCCYNEMKLLPSATVPNVATILPSTEVSAPTSTATSLSSDSPANPYEFDTEPGTTSSAYPSGNYPLTSQSCPSSPNGPHCHVSPALPPSACSTPIGNGRLSMKQDRIELGNGEEDDVRPMEVCSDDGETLDDAATRDVDVLDDEPKDFSMKTIGAVEAVNSGGWPTNEGDTGRVRPAKQYDDCSKKELKTAPKKKWIRHYMNVEQDNYQASPFDEHYLDFHFDENLNSLIVHNRIDLINRNSPVLAGVLK
uniref:Uncharacterized protein n=1 Tax=Anopheles maculatus TaxID=74869 RepID=A0A182SHI7_9DIPT